MNSQSQADVAVLKSGIYNANSAIQFLKSRLEQSEQARRELEQRVFNLEGQVAAFDERLEQLEAKLGGE